MDEVRVPALAGIPYARTHRSTYENFIALCPHCGFTNTFNRVTDLGTTVPIDFRTVTCFNQPACGKPFNINSDSINSPHEMLIHDALDLIEQKRYMHSVLSLVQAWEVFFSLYFRVTLLYRPFARERSYDLDRLNELIRLLAERLGAMTFRPMRELFLRMSVSKINPPDLSAAEPIIRNIQPGDRTPTDAADIDSLADIDLRGLLQRVRGSRVNDLRNRVVHKQAYRPSRSEAEAVLEETRSVILPLTRRLDLYEDINWYMMEAARARQSSRAE